VGIAVLTSASILVPGTLYNLGFIDSTVCYRLIRLDGWTVVTMVFYAQDYLVSGPCHSAPIEKMNTFVVWICSFLRCGGHLLGWDGWVFSITGQYMSGEVSDSLHGYAHTTKDHCRMHPMECLQNNHVAGNSN
jgi:hypothetical protein